MSEMFEVALPTALAALLAYISLRAFRHKRALLRWGIGGLAALAGLLAAITSVLAIAGLARLQAYEAPAGFLRVAGAAEQLHRGRKIADGFCSGCHSPSDAVASLAGGLDLGKHLPLPLGSFVAPNLTPAGPIAPGRTATSSVRFARASIPQGGGCSHVPDQCRPAQQVSDRLYAQPARRRPR